MAVDSILASPPLTVTSQIVEQTNQQVKQVREGVEKAVTEGGESKEQAVSPPGSQPVEEAQSASRDGGQNQGASDDGDDGGGTTPSPGNVVNITA